MKINFDRLLSILFILFFMGALWYRDIDRVLSSALISVLFYRCYLYGKNN